jgi:hypothetical protein
MGVFDGVLYQLSHYLVEDNVSHLQANTFRQMKMFLCVRENQNCATKQEISKI